MAKKGVQTSASPMTWEQFQTLVAKLTYDIDHNLKVEEKRVQASRFLLLISLGCFCGLRISDILNLRWVDIYNKEELLVIEKKTGKSRKITFNPQLQKIISSSRERIHPQTTDEYLFVNKSAGVLSIQYINRKLKGIFKEYKIKVKNPSSHTLRKTFGLRVFEMNFKSDEALILLSQIFRHANTAITRRYIGLQEEKIENVYLRL